MPFPNSSVPSDIAPRVSIVMTTYNGARYLDSQIDSILRQSVTDFELIIHDDCSSDVTPELLRAHAQRDQRIVLSFNKENLGIARNLEQALGNARGDFIAIADQDDVWNERKLEILLDGIGAAAAIYSDSLLIDGDSCPLGSTLIQRAGIVRPPRGHQAVELLWQNCVSGHALLFRRRLLDIVLPFDDCMMFDHQIAVFAALTDGLVYVDQPLVGHRIHGANQTNGRLAERKSRAVGGGRAARVERIRGKRLRYASRLQFCAERIRATPELRKVSGLERLGARMSALAAGMSRFEGVGFDVKLFFLLLRHRKEVFYLGSGSAFRYCVKYAKGELYYRNR